MAFVYILECFDKTLYTGSAVDINKRIRKHNEGKGAKYTRGRLPVKLVYLEETSSYSEALKREYQIKKMMKQEKLDVIEKNSKNICFINSNLV